MIKKLAEKYKIEQDDVAQVIIELIRQKKFNELLSIYETKSIDELEVELNEYNELKFKRLVKESIDKVKEDVLKKEEEVLIAKEEPKSDKKSKTKK
jgi:hypothetical protein